MSGTRVIFENGRWWRDSAMTGSLYVQSTHQRIGGPWSIRELIIPRGHDTGQLITDREMCAARGCYLCRVVLDEAATE